MIIPSTSDFFTSASFLLTAVVFLFYLYLKYIVYNFWSRKEVPHEKPCIPLGNIPISYFKGETLYGNVVKETYTKFKKSRFSGIYILWEPVLIIHDLELIRLVLLKNSTQFYNRGRFIDEHKDPLSATLDRMNDEKWKRLRGKLSPAFSSGKLKLMYALIEEICCKLVDALGQVVVETGEVEFKEISTRYTIDCISSTAYGFNADSLNNSESLFLKYGRSSSYIGRVFLLGSLFVPQLFRFITVPAKRKKNEKFFIDFFLNIVNQRRKENTARNDFVDMLMRLVDYGKIDEENVDSSTKRTEADKLTMTEGIAQSFFFFSSGQETVSTLITGCFYELALNPDVQQQLFTEIYEMQKSPGGLTYDKLFEMQYLDMIVQEALRKYPVVPILSRICTEDFEVPESKLVIKKGTRIFIPIEAMHMDPDIYPEPEKFDPTRFTPENKIKRHNLAHLPFGTGPRHCIGNRLAMLEGKMAICHLLLNYVFSPCKKTPSKIKFLPDSMLYVPYDVTLNVKKRNLQKEKN